MQIARMQIAEFKFLISHCELGFQISDSRFQIPDFELLIHIESDCSEIRKFEI